MPDFLVKAGSRWPKRRDFLGRGGRCNRNELLLRWGRKRYRQRQQPSRRETLRQSHHAAALLATAPTICTAALINRISVTRMTPSPGASPRSPRLVSRVMAVVIVRVTPAILPPTIRMAPTSATARQTNPVENVELSVVAP